MATPEDKVSFGYRTVGAEEKKRLVHDQFTPIARTYDQADAEHLSFRDSSFEAVTVGFGLRNLADLYLAESIRVFDPPEGVAGRLDRTGFIDVAFQPLSLGIAVIYSGRKPKEVPHAADQR